MKAPFLDCRANPPSLGTSHPPAIAWGLSCALWEQFWESNLVAFFQLSRFPLLQIWDQSWGAPAYCSPFSLRYAFRRGNSSCVPHGAMYLKAALPEEAILNLRQFHGRGAFFFVVRQVIDPGAYGIAPQQQI